MSTIEALKEENRVFEPLSKFSHHATVQSLDAYHALCQAAENDYEGFWAQLARQNIIWHKPFTQILDESNAPFYRWFADGTLNVSYNCLDRHLNNGHADKTAIIFEADDGAITHVSFRQLHEKVCRLANALKQQGIKKSDRVVIYMPMSIESICAMQACARIGAIHSVVFGGFSEKSLYERIIDTQAVAIITADEHLRGGKKLPLKAIVDKALAMDKTDTVAHVIVYQRTGGEIFFHVGRDFWMHEIISSQSAICEPEWIESEHPLFILYTSGSTGSPKGILHASAGYLMWARQTMLWTFDLKPYDIFWCTADIGWITGHTYIAYGPIAAGATQIIFEGIPTFPNASRFWQIIERHKATIFYTAPTAIRSLIKASEQDEKVHPSQFNLSSLRLLGSVGEPINPETWIWYYNNVGKASCPIVDTFWQTETGGQMITPLPGATPMVPGSCALPLPGIMAAIVDEAGHDLPNGQGGLLVIKRPWPSMIRTIWGNPEHFKSSYFPQEFGEGTYLAGDGAVRSLDRGYFTITGRIDDVLNVSGHRLGTMEIESALVANPLVAEAAIVGKPDETTGESICAFVVLKHNRPEGIAAHELAQVLRAWVAREIGAIAKPREIRFSDNLPKTRSGKIMRRLLRVIAKGEPITQDISTLENPAILEQLKTSV